MKKIDSKYYRKNVKCLNCGHIEKDIKIPKGTYYKIYSTDLVCKNCGCKIFMNDLGYCRDVFPLPKELSIL